MGIVVIEGFSSETPRQRWANVLTIITAIGLFLYGLNVRDNTLNAVTPYNNIRAGITAFYPANWLLDTGENSIFRVRDMTQPGFKTTIQITIQPISAATTERNIADRLALIRAQTFTDYNVLSIEPYLLRNEVTAQAVAYSYVNRDTSPFQAGVPVVVTGLDIIALSRGQALIMTFRAQADVYDREIARFEQFLSTLDF
jgi:hypothetical protein